MDCFVFRSYPILGLSPLDFVANCRYSRGSQNQWHAEKQGTQRAKHNSHLYENQGWPACSAQSLYSETVCRALIMTNNRHKRKEKREVILSSVQEIFPKL